MTDQSDDPFDLLLEGEWDVDLAMTWTMKSGPSAVRTTCHPKASGVTLWRSMSSFVVAGAHGGDLADP
jgi:hypothetical protein